MGEVKGPVQLSGSIGNTTYYNKDGKTFTRRRTVTVTADMIQTLPSLEEVKQNVSEFGKASLTAKSVYAAIKYFSYQASVNKLYAKLTGLFTRVIKEDTLSEPGERSLIKGLGFRKGFQLLKDFALNPCAPLSTKLHGEIMYATETNSLHIKNLEPSDRLKKRVTHLELMVIVVEIDLNTYETMAYTGDAVVVQKGKSDMGEIILTCDPLEHPEHSRFVILCCQDLIKSEENFYDRKGKDSYALQFVDFKV
ncbi:hypothetical protein [Zhouia amylolytica]|uniref:Uncharacterized protein n=1 Tax=Zhouia amylolytica AD3 TaxID=1286632 RepID=W2UT58_9FLAO|nr:hypothetical protein [Zhouia amylolytica]ETN96686.1 hypothetical protein P278_01120 [Zhouia amylolytica AD3]